MKTILSAGSRAGSCVALSAAILVAVASFLGGCQPQPQTDEALNERVVALEKSLAEVSQKLDENQKILMTQLGHVKVAQQSMIRRGLLVSPELMEKPIGIGEQTTVRVGGAPSLGPTNAAVEVVEYGEFQCPFCMKADSFLADVVEEFPGQVRVAFKHYPIARHKMSVNAGRAAWAAQQQGKFWEMHDALFSARGKLDEDVIRAHAEAVGLDMEKFEEDYNSHAATRAVYDDRREAKANGVKGTPSFYVNGKFMGGQPEGVRKGIRNALRDQEKAAQAREAAKAKAAQLKAAAGS